jgi:PAS domain-containing protein
MKLRSQILLAQAPTVFTIFLVTFFFILALTTIEHESGAILEDNVKCIVTMETLKESLENLNNYIVNHPESSNGEVKRLENKVEKELILKEKLPTVQEEEKKLMKSLRKQWEAYQISRRFLFPDNKIERRYEVLKRIMDEIIGLNQDELIRKKNNLSNFITEYRLFISTSAIISLIFGFFMSWIFLGLVLSPLNKMIEIVSQFGKTDETIILNIKGSEEIEQLSNEFNLMTDRLEAYHQSSLGHIIEDYESLKMVFDAFPDPLILFNSENDIIFINRLASQLFGILGSVKKKNPLLFLEDSLRESLLKAVKQVILTKRTYIPEKIEEPLMVLKKKKKILLLPFAYPIKGKNDFDHSKVIGVFVILQGLTHDSLSAIKAGKIFRTVIQDFQASLAEIQMAIHTSLQETAGPLTEKQKEVLYGARDKCDELETLSQDLLKVSHMDHRNE